MEVIGFARDSKQQFVTVVIQPYIIGDLITEDERISFMHGLDFEDAGMDYGMHLNYKTDTLYVGDLNEFNVIKGETGLNVIDADCRLNVPTLECSGKYSITHPEIDFSNPYSEWLEYLVTGQKF